MAGDDKKYRKIYRNISTLSLVRGRQNYRFHLYFSNENLIATQKDRQPDRTVAL